MRALILLLLPGLALCADDDAKKPDLPPAIANVVDLARSAPPELFADTVVKLAEGGVIPAGPAQSALLKEAFDAAGRAEEPVRLIPVPGIPPDTRAAFRAKAAALRLDRLSLRARVVKLLSLTDPATARKLFEGIEHPSIERAPCANPLIPDASAYMEMAGVIAHTGFSAQEKKDERHIEFLQAVLDGAKSPGEVAGFARAIAPLTFTAEEWQLLLAALAAKLEAVAPDYRSFTTSVDSMRAPLEEFMSRARDQKFDASQLAPGFRRFLTQQMSGPRCDEDFGEARPAVEWFNATFRGNLAPIADEEIEPSQRQESFQAENYFITPEAKHISQALDQLKIAPGVGPRSEADRDSPEWRGMFSDFLRDFGAWTPTGSEIDTFHQKLTILRGLFELVAPGAERDQLIAQCVGVLQTSRVETLFPAEWLLQVKALADAAGPDSPKLMQAFRASGDAGLALFASL